VVSLKKGPTLNQKSEMLADSVLGF
jgi:hypothetical protein